MKKSTSKINKLGKIKKYVIFHRTWWQHHPDCYGDLIADSQATKHIVGFADTVAHARQMCKDWNKSFYTVGSEVDDDGYVNPRIDYSLTGEGTGTKDKERKLLGDQAEYTESAQVKLLNRTIQ